MGDPEVVGAAAGEEMAEGAKTEAAGQGTKEVRQAELMAAALDILLGGT